MLGCDSRNLAGLGLVPRQSCREPLRQSLDLPTGATHPNFWELRTAPLRAIMVALAILKLLALNIASLGALAVALVAPLLAERHLDRDAPLGSR